MAPSNAFWLPALVRAPVLALGDESVPSAPPAARAGAAARAYLSPELKLRAGPLIAVAGAELEWWRSSASGPLFYEPARDTLLKAAGGRRFGLRRPTLGANVSYYLDDPFKRHQLGAAAALAFAVTR